MTQPQNKYTGVGMILGTAIGSALGIVLMVLTGQAWWIALGGAGVGVGLVLGAAADRK